MRIVTTNTINMREPMGHETEDTLADEEPETEEPDTDDAGCMGVTNSDKAGLEDIQPEECTTRIGRKAKTPEPHQATHHADDVAVREIDSELGDEEILPFDQEEYQLHVDTLQWLELDEDVITGMMFAAKQTSIQQGVKKHGQEAKKSVMKEIVNLTQNDCFGETEYESLSQEDKDKAMPISMFMTMKINGSLKSRGVANRSVQ